MGATCETGAIWIWFAGNGNIRKWSHESFPEGVKYVAAASVAGWLNSPAPLPDVVWDDGGDAAVCALTCQHLADAIARADHLSSPQRHTSEEGGQP